jgi:hypothetical protein
MSGRYGNIKTCREKRKFFKTKKFLKKLLTNESGRDKISELPLRTTATKVLAPAKQEVMIFDK